MSWWYMIILFGVVAYFVYRSNVDKKRKKEALSPKCEVCQTPMELQTKLGDNEIWECPKCSQSNE